MRTQKNKPDSCSSCRLGTGTRLILVTALLCLGSTGCQSYRATPDAAARDTQRTTIAVRDVESIADEYLSALLEYRPEMGTLYSLPGARHDRLTDHSPEALLAWEAREDAWLAELGARGVPVDVGGRDWVTYGILYETLAATSATRICRNELWAASSMTAWHRGVPTLFETQPVDTPELQQQALQRLASLPKYIDTEIANLRRGLELGYSAPRLTVAPAVNEIRALAAADSPLLSPGVRAGNPKFAAEVQALFAAEVSPAVERFAHFLESEYLVRAREGIGLGLNPDGPHVTRPWCATTPPSNPRPARFTDSGWSKSPEFAPKCRRSSMRISPGRPSRPS